MSEDLRSLANRLEALLGTRLHALLVVGGYARGEGSVVERGGVLGPYNDYDLIAVLRSGRRGPSGAIRRFAQEWSARLNVEVDVLVVRERRFARPPYTLFWLDAALGGARVLSGDRSVLRSLSRVKPRRVPLSECGRLLANRAAGIALSNLEGPGAGLLRMALHAHKAILACGDARLLAADRYAPTLAARAVEIQKLEAAPGMGRELVEAYLEAVAFRSRPDRWLGMQGAVLDWWERTRRLVSKWHLEFEAWRTGAPTEPSAFVRWPGRLYADAPDFCTGWSFLSAVRAAMLGKAPLFRYFGHPRERLARAAVALAYLSNDPGRHEAARLLGSRIDSPPSELRSRLEALIPIAG